MKESIFSSVEAVLEDIAAGKMVILLDDEDRENEGDLVMAAQFATPEAVNFMITHARGLLCVPMLAEKAEKLGLTPMISSNTDPNGTAFTISVDAIESTTGISAFERSNTVCKLANPKSAKEDFWHPGHIFPLVAKEKGVVERCGHTEASVDLARWAGLEPVGAICEIINEDGSMARLPGLVAFSQKHGMKVLTIAEMVRWKKEKDSEIEPISRAELPTKYGDFTMLAYENGSGEPEVAIVKGDVAGREDVLVRLHSECLTGDVFGSYRCDCGEQLAEALKKIEEKGEGIVLYLRQEGRGIGLANKLKAYALQEQGHDTVEANHLLGFPTDLRDFSVGAKILKSLGVKSIQLMTNNPEKITELEKFGITVSNRIPASTEVHDHSKKYIQTKVDKLGHLF